MTFNCKNDPRYTRYLLEKKYLNLFPAQGQLFNCYISTTPQSLKTSLQKKHLNALLYLPDSLAYNCSLIILISGVIMSIALIAYGLKYEKKFKFENRTLFEKYMNEINKSNFILESTLSKSDKLKLKETETKIINDVEDDNVESIELTQFSPDSKNNLTISDNINRTGTLSHEDFKKLSSAGYHVGRIGGIRASSSRLSANTSLKSSCESLHHDSDHSFDGPVFYLDIIERSPTPDLYHHAINIPQSIIEEDETSVIARKSKSSIAE